MTLCHKMDLISFRPAAGLLLVVTTALAMPAWGSGLEFYQWKNRLLLVMAPNDSDPRLVAMEKRLSASKDDVRDRDMLTIRLLEAGFSGRADRPLSRAEVQTLRQRYGAKPGGFSVILIGKDGGVKLVQEEQVSLQAVFDLIDTMPMRRREMRQRGAGGQDVNGG